MSELDKSGNWEREILEKLALAALKEQRVARRWGIFFKLLWFVFLFAVLAIIMGWTGTANIDICSD